MRPILPYSDSKRAHQGPARRLSYWLVLLLTAIYATFRYLDTPIGLSAAETPACPYSPKFVSPANLSYFRSSAYKAHSLKVWQGAVQIYTPSYDDLGPIGKDPRWDVFYQYENYLVNSFPHIASQSELVHVNTHGLVFILNGTEPSLKPLLLMGHQDVVPVPPETVARWTHNPFEGYFDGQWLWGRGSGDNKNDHIALLEGLEQTLKEGLRPKRTVIVALGIDEEASGQQGAGAISKYLLQRYGKDSVYFIVDEGGGVMEQFGTRFAFPATGEKGYLDVTIELLTSGGHSSVPPRHTAIGIVSELVTLIEEKPYDLELTPKNPFYATLQCVAAQGNSVPPVLRKNVPRMHKSKAAKKKVLRALDKDMMFRYLASTSQAVDIVYGGLKINALPEKVTLMVNHRVGYDSSIDEVKARITANVKKVAKKYHLGLEGFDSSTSSAADWPVDVPAGKFVLSTFDTLLAAPTSPTTGRPWELLSGTIRHIFEDFAVFPDSEAPADVIVSPAIMSGNTDTKFFWDITRNIYRFSPGRGDSAVNAHAIDERVDLDAHVEGVAFYYSLLKTVAADDA